MNVQDILDTEYSQFTKLTFLPLLDNIMIWHVYWYLTVTAIHVSGMCTIAAVTSCSTYMYDDVIVCVKNNNGHDS